MNFYRYLALSECVSFLDIVFVWYKLNNVFFVFRFEDFQNFAYEGLAALLARVELVWTANHECDALV